MLASSVATDAAHEMNAMAAAPLLKAMSTSQNEKCLCAK
jgi:hypothetical protein